MELEDKPLMADYCHYTAYADPCCDGCALCKFRRQHLWVFIQTEKINNKTRDSGLSSESLIRSSYSRKTIRVTHDTR